MFSETSSEPAADSRALSSMLARRSVKRRRREFNSEQQLQKSSAHLLMKHQNISELLLEITSSSKIRSCDKYSGPNQISQPETSVLEDELRRRSEQMEVPVGLLSVRVLAKNIQDLMTEIVTDAEHLLLNVRQRADLCALLKSARDLQSVGLVIPELLWQECWKTQPILEVMHHLHTHNILTLEHMLERDEAVSSWISDQLKALCVSMATSPEEQEMKQEILSTVVGVLVRRGFESPSHKLTETCCSVLDTMMSWLLDSMNNKHAEQSETAAGVWVQMFDTSLFSLSVSEDTLQRFFTYTLICVLTHRPTFTVSDAIAVQSEWTFAKTPPLLTTLFCKICLVFGVERVLSQLQHVLETQEVNWRHVLSCLSNLLIYHRQTQQFLTDLLSRLLRSAFDGYDLEKMITSFLLARQAALEGPAVFLSYSQWFKLSFGGTSGYHGKNKRSTLFLFKFLSDLVPFEPPQYLKVHVMYPPYIKEKYRPVLQEYITLSKTRLADLKVSLQDSGIFEVVNGSAGEVHCSAQQDVVKAITLFMTNNKIPTTVMEASIFRRPYFLNRFLPALLSPQTLPVKEDARSSFIEALRKADKIPAALYTAYTDRKRHRQQDAVCESLKGEGEHLIVLQEQFIHLRKLLTAGAADGEISAQLSRISLTLRSECSDEDKGCDVITLNLKPPDSARSHAAVVSLILQNFCLCLLAASKISPPNRWGSWSGVFLKVLLGHRWLFSPLTRRLWDLLHNQGDVLSPAHVLGLAALLVELHRCRDVCPTVEVMESSGGVFVSEALSDALTISTRSGMAFSLRFCVCVLCYGLCRANVTSEELQNFIPERLYKKMLFVMPRLIPETRSQMSDESESVRDDVNSDMWRNITDLTGRVKDSAVALWRHKRIRSLRQQPQYQLSFSEWLSAELHVQRSQDALTDPERQEYEQWACVQYYLPMSVCDGGSGGDVTRTCAQIITAVLEQQTVSETSPALTDTCLPDLQSQLQVLLYEVVLIQKNASDETGHFLWDLIENRCSVRPDAESIGPELEIQQTLHNISRVLVMVPAPLLVTVRTNEPTRCLDCNRLMKHINYIQRKACCPAGVLSYTLTAHILKAVVSASVSCDRPTDAVNETLCDSSSQCPLLLISAVHWWPRLAVVVNSHWRRLTGGDVLPKQMQMLEECHAWSRKVSQGLAPPVPSASSWLLAASLHSLLERSDSEFEIFKPAFRQIEATDGQVLLFLFLYSIKDVLSAHLNLQDEACLRRARELGIFLLNQVLDRSDWLLLFEQSGSEHRLSHFMSCVMSDQSIRLMPLAFYSIITHLDPVLLTRAVGSPGFLYTAAVSYRNLNELFLNDQTEQRYQQVLTEARRVLLNSISWSSPDCLTHSQRRRLESDYEQMDSEIAASLSIQLNNTFSSHKHFK